MLAIGATLLLVGGIYALGAKNQRTKDQLQDAEVFIETGEIVRDAIKDSSGNTTDESLDWLRDFNGQ